MKALASFILRGPSQAILVAVGTAVLAMMLPPLSVISGAVVALVTLRAGIRPGGIVMLGSAAFVALLAYVSLGNLLIGGLFLIVLWLPIWILAWVLRETRSLTWATSVAGVLGIIGVLVTYALVGDVSAWWEQTLRTMFEPAMAAGGPLADRETVLAILANLAKIMTGVAAAGMTLNALMCLYLARAWQAQLYNPGGFRDEFYALRLGQRTADTKFITIGTGGVTGVYCRVVVTAGRVESHGGRDRHCDPEPLCVAGPGVDPRHRSQTSTAYGLVGGVVSGDALCIAAADGIGGGVGFD